MSKSASHAQIENKTNFFTTLKDSDTGDHTLVLSLDTPIDLTGANVTLDPTNLALEAGNLANIAAALGVAPAARGVSGLPFTSADQHSAAASVTDAPTTGQKIVLDEMIISSDTAMSVTFKCETSGVVALGPLYMSANSTQHINFRGKGRKLGTADKKLQVITSVAGNVMVDVAYHSEA